MAATARGGEPAPPTDDELAALLGPAAEHWAELRRRAGEWCEPSSEVWAWARSTGWGLRVKRRDRIIVYLAPREGHVLASFALGDRAVEAARGAGLPARVLGLLDAARRYAEGTGVRIDVRAPEDVEAVLTLVGIKLAH